MELACRNSRAFKYEANWKFFQCSSARPRSHPPLPPLTWITDVGSKMGPWKILIDFGALSNVNGKFNVTRSELRSIFIMIRTEMNEIDSYAFKNKYEAEFKLLSVIESFTNEHGQILFITCITSDIYINAIANSFFILIIFILIISSEG